MYFQSVDWVYNEDDCERGNPVVRSWIVSRTCEFGGKTTEIVVHELLSGDIFMSVSQGDKEALFYPGNDKEILVIANCFMHFGK